MNDMMSLQQVLIAAIFLSFFSSKQVGKAAAFTPVPNVDCSSSPQSGYPFCDTGVHPLKRAEDLVSRLTLGEAINQTIATAPAIPRLGLKAYNWRSNCLHGWSKSGGHWDPDMKWTVFPAPIGLGATFDTDLIQQVGAVTATEGRALHNEMLVNNEGSSTEAAGLNCYSPNVNLFRDPRWGRGQETFGEDPYLISMIGNAYTNGLQGDDDRYLKLAACAKHYVVHSGPEEIRNKFTANVSLHDLYDTYLPAFKSQVMGANVAQIMPALSGVNCSKQTDGAPDAANQFLLKTVLREEFSAPNVSVCSDNEALPQVYHDHHYVSSLDLAAAVCMNATTDLDLGYNLLYALHLPSAMKDGLVAEDTIRESVIRSFYLRMLVGDFDPPSKVPFQLIDKSSLDTEDNRKVNLDAARKSIVLLKNDKNSLPLQKESIKRIAVIGPNANDSRVMLSNYEGVPSSIVTVLEGIMDYLVDTSVKIDYAQGCDIFCANKSTFRAAMDIAKDADFVVMVIGLNYTLEREAHDRMQTSCEGVDVPLLGLPGCQSDLVEAVTQVNPRVFVVLINGGPLSIEGLLSNKKVLGILEAFYPGAVGGTAVADVLFGAYNPSGRMPVTTYNSTTELPPAENYDMNLDPGRTYRYYKNKPLIPFGFGLSYSDVTYSNLTLSKKDLHPCDSTTVSLVVTSSNPKMPVDEAVLLYLLPHPANQKSSIFPIQELIGFERVHVVTKESVSFNINPYLMSLVDSDGINYIFPGTYTVQAGNSTADFKITSGSPVKVSTCTKSPQCLAC